MRILYLSQYFPPEAGATQARALEQARALVRHGHSVTMLTEFPNHPSGILAPGYQCKWFERDQIEDIQVIRVWVKTSPHKNFKTRLLFYLSFMLNAALAGLFLVRGRYDLLYCSSPPLFCGAAGLFLSWVKRLPFVFEVRDLWPESAVALGELSNPTWVGWSERLETACYRRARRIIVATQGIRQRLIEHNLPTDKLAWIANGANLAEFQFDPSTRARLRAELGWQDCFVVVYTGVFGVAQGLETVLAAASLLRSEPGVRFLMIGDGARREEIIAQAGELDLSNLVILPEQPRHAIPGYLSAGDVALVPLRRLELFKGALPSKIFDAWACRRAVLLTVDGESRQVVEDAHGGAYVEPENPPALAAAILRLRADPAGCLSMGENGRIYAAAHFDRQVIGDRLVKILEEVVAGN